MSRHAMYNTTTGQITRIVMMPEGMDPVAFADEAFVELPGDANDLTHMVDVTTGRIMPIVKHVDQLRAEKRAQINSARQTANISFNFAGKAVASDEAGRANIDGINGYVSLTGELPPGWPGIWKALDNDFVPIPTVGEWVAFYGAMVARVQQNFARSELLKSQLAAATTAEEIAAIQIVY